jgi:hypothetical protein
VTNALQVTIYFQYFFLYLAVGIELGLFMLLPAAKGARSDGILDADYGGKDLKYEN